MSWINPRLTTSAGPSELQIQQERIDRSPALQEIFARQRAYRAAHPGGVWSLITSDELRAGWHEASAGVREALAAAGVTIPKGYTFDFSGSGQLVKDEGGFNWLLAAGVLAAPLAVAFLPGIIAGSGASATTGAAGATGAVLPSSSIPLATSAVVPTIASQGASAAVYAGASSAVGAVASAGAVAATGATGGAATAVKVATAVAPKVAGLLAPRSAPYEPLAPGMGVLFEPAPEGGLLATLQNPMVLTALVGVVILAVVLARK